MSEKDTLETKNVKCDGGKEATKSTITDKQRIEGASVLAVKFAAFCTPMGM